MLFIDYLTFTWNNKDALSWNMYHDGQKQLTDFYEVFPELAAWVQREEVDTVAKMRNYYTDQILLDPLSQFTIWYSKLNAAQGVMVNVPGSAMYQIAQLLGDGCMPDGEAVPSYKVDAWPVLEKIVKRGGVVTRIDVAYDDYSKKFTPRDMMNYWLDGKISTPCRYAKCVASRQSGSDTFYLGKRGSERLLRIYDKAAESEGEIDAIRWEFEYRKAKAQAVALSIAAGHTYSMQKELLGDEDHVGFLVIKEYGVLASSEGGLNPGDKNYQYEHEKKSDSAIYEAWEHFVKHEIKVPDTETVYISTKKEESHVRGMLLNLRNNMKSICRCHMVVDKAGLRDEFNLAWRMAYDRIRSELTTSEERLRFDALTRELREDPEAINILR